MPARGKSRRFRGKRLNWSSLILTAIVSFSFGIGVGLLTRGPVERAVGPLATSREERPETPSPKAEAGDAPAAARPKAPVQVEPPSYPAAQGSRVALVIDDLGRSLRQLEVLRGLGVTISYSVLPFEPRTSSVVADLQQRGEEILCHLPMEASNGADPGPGALTLEMSSAELVSATRGALEQVPGAVGVNNHMGSRLSADRRSMRAVVQVLADDGLFYLDSRTSADSLGYRLAVEAGVPAAERHVFLDADLEPATVRVQFGRLLSLAREKGAAIAIGHPSDTTVGVLRQEIPRALEAGYEFVPVSYLLDRTEVLPAPG